MVKIQALAESHLQNEFDLRRRRNEVIRLRDAYPSS
jgi:hypothetical protein